MNKASKLHIGLLIVALILIHSPLQTVAQVFDYDDDEIQIVDEFVPADVDEVQAIDQQTAADIDDTQTVNQPASVSIDETQAVDQQISADAEPQAVDQQAPVSADSQADRQPAPSDVTYADTKAAGELGETPEDAEPKPSLGMSALGYALAFPSPEFSIGVVTIDDEPWTRLALGLDIPIWKLGVFLDLELFIDNDNKVSNKGWDFRNSPADAIFRKIRYIRYGFEEEPLFVRFGGLEEVTLGYGIIMDRFTNMLNYPNEKLLGLQFYLNDVSPYGITVQTLISDFAEVADDGGIFAGRLAFKPLQALNVNMPIIRNLAIGGTVAHDRNTYAPMRKWRRGGSGADNLLLEIHKRDWYEEYRDLYEELFPGENLDDIIARIEREVEIAESTRGFTVLGIDAGLQLVYTRLLNLTLYSQYAQRADDVTGWALAVPGFAFRMWRLRANLEYRMVEGRYTPGFFDTYYLDERLLRFDLVDSIPKDKSQYLASESLQGIFGRVRMDIGILDLDGSYQHLFGEGDAKDQHYEGIVGIGSAVMERIPRLNLAEIYVRNTNIGRSFNIKYDKDGEPDESGKLAGPFDRTPFMFWGYRAGVEVALGASVILDYRYGWRVDLDNGRLVPDNQMLLQMAVMF
ncbi:MAG: hypothetical protein LBU70_08715 [Chitinispirillales bacterium]|jgi:hypothetical protein|nr:hypothetical protein [Chitinispirillales bacterium]